jgi:hypothetical protein
MNFLIDAYNRSLKQLDGMKLKPIATETIQPYGQKKKYSYTLMGTNMEYNTLKSTLGRN